MHFLHVGKTGGSAIKHTLRSAKLAAFADADDEDTSTLPVTPYGPIQLHRAHRFRMGHLPVDDRVFFCVRDPMTRFVSGFYSRLRKGQPRHFVEWSEQERKAFEAFPTAQLLATALMSADEDERQHARRATRAIVHLRPMTQWLGSAANLRERADQIIHIARQETLSSDWEQLKSILTLPPEIELPADPVLAHRTNAPLEAVLDDAAVENLRRWYENDYELLEYCDQLRAERGWGTAPPPRAVARPSSDRPGRSPPTRSSGRASQAVDVAAVARDSRNRLELWDSLIRGVDARTVVEIGVYRGAFAEHILSTCSSVETYYMIDPWRRLDDLNEPANRRQDAFERYFQEAMQRTRDHERRRVVLRGRTIDVIDRIPDESVDFAYVDADHTLRAIIVDLLRVYPKVRPRGWIGGDDDFSRSIWQHGATFEPTAVFPVAVYLAEAVGARIYGLPHHQFLIEKLPEPAFRFDDLTSDGERDRLSQVRPRKARSAAGPAARLRRAPARPRGASRAAKGIRRRARALAKRALKRVRG